MVAALTLFHRWLAVPLAPLFAMWFASGIVMHVVPFPRLTEAERIAGIAPLDLSRAMRGPGDAVAASGLAAATRVRLVERSDGPVYVVTGPSSLAALHADDLSDARVRAPELARAIALGHARQRGLSADAAGAAQLIGRDQWTVAGDLDRHRPLYLVALNDEAGRELYVSSATGEVVRDTTRRERWWNMLGSIPHWIYLTSLRSRPQLWSAVVWSLSLAGSFAALAGVALGTTLLVARRGLVAPAGSWQAWHHALGLLCGGFVLSWIVSGWLSLDNGFLFSTGRLSAAEAGVLAPAPPWDSLPAAAPIVAARTREVEWFVFGATLYRRDRTGLDKQVLRIEGSASETAPRRAYLTLPEVAAVARRLQYACGATAIDVATDSYASPSPVPDAPLYRIACGDLWFQVDGASGAVVDRLDPSRRDHRWLYGALHTLDLPWLTARPALRGALVIGLCGCGLAFSLTGCVIAWRRLRQWLTRDDAAIRGQM